MAQAPATSLDPAPHPKRPSGPSRRVMEHVSCNHCGRDVTHGVHNVSRLVRCVNCGLIFVSPRPDFEDLALQYEGSYFNCPTPTFGGYENYEADREDILRTFRGRMKLIRPLLGSAAPRLLDVGCATGIFLEVAREAGWHGEGVDISAYALARAREKGFEVHRGTLIGANLPESGYDLITMWDLIEHVPDPAAVLSECHRLLRPGGVIAISTPDAGSLPARILGSRWLGFRSIDEHLYFFSRRSMQAMLEAAGFEVGRIVAVGKYLALARLVERMRFYTRIGALLLRAADRAVPRVSVYVNPGDTMVVLATRPGPRADSAR
jgi:2-polyprenyl-3-methyl-5-hydroxy-6-metoxy-1,4-benzoquinol methylase